MADTTADTIVRTKNALKSKKSNYSSLCDRISDYYCPETEVNSETSEGSELVQPITSTGILATTRLQNGLYSNTMAMGKGNIISPNKQVMEVPIAKEWYAELSNVVQHHVSQSGFAKRFQEWLGDYCNFGGSVMYPYWDKVAKQHKFYVYPENSCFYTLDQDRRMTSMYREYEFTAQQAVAEFGYDKVSADVQKAYDKYDEEARFKFVHCMRARRNRDEKKTDAKNKAFESIHVMEGDNNKVVRESGTDQFRYVNAHFYTKTGEDSGRAPTMQALPVMRTLSRTVDLLLNATEMAIGAPVWFPDKNAAETARLEPFFVGYYDPNKGEPWTYRIDPAVLRENKELYMALTDEINQLFFVDLFAMLEQQKTGAKTAFEVSQLVAERTQAIAPIANSLSGFFRDVYQIIARDLVGAEMVDAPPDEAYKDKEVELEVSYTSRLDIRLKEIENISQLEAVNQAAVYNKAVQESPVIQACTNPLKATLSIFESHNVDPANLRNFDEAEKELQAMQTAAANAKQQEMAASQVKPLDLQAAPEDGSAMGGMLAEGTL